MGEISKMNKLKGKASIIERKKEIYYNLREINQNKFNIKKRLICQICKKSFFL